MTKESPAIVAFKTWIFPGLVSLMGMMIWNGVNEIKADIKALMAQSNIDKTRIDNLEREVFNMNKTASYPFQREEPKVNEYAILADNRLKLKKNG